jgi:hypothetical protein
MMLPLAFILVGATPVETIAHNLADYSECLRVNAGRPDRQAATERAQFAIEQCRLQRETSIRFVIGQLETPSNSTTVRARIEESFASLEALYPAILAAGGGVEIPPPIARQVRQYTDCLVEQIQARGGLQASADAAYIAGVEASIAACATVRTAALAEAETVLSESPGFEDAARRREAISRAFDQTAEVQRNFPHILHTISQGQGTNAGNH